MSFDVIADLNKEKAINMIVGDQLECYEHFSTTHTIYADTDISDIMWEIENELESIQEELKKKNNEIEQEKTKLSKLPFHEILEIGESKGLWKQTEKQRRLIQ